MNLRQPFFISSAFSFIYNHAGNNQNQSGYYQRKIDYVWHFINESVNSGQNNIKDKS